MSKEKVMAALEPKAQPFGFNSEELQSVGDRIVEILPEGATDDDITKAVESYIPILKLAQSASNRSFEKMKAQFEKEHPVPPKPQKPTETQKPEEKPSEQKPNNEEPEWFKAYRQQMEQKLKDQEDTIASMKKEKTSEGLMTKAVAKLKEAGVDKNFYALMLDGKIFASEDEVNALVDKVKTGWETLKKERDIKELVAVTPPKAAHVAPDKPSQAVLDRIEKRKKAKVSSAITGSEDSK